MSASTVDDVLQETALAAWRSMAVFEDEAHLLGWATTVSRRLAIAEFRRRRHVHGGVAPDIGFEHVEAQALARVDLERVAASMAELAPQDRLDLAEVETPVDRKEAVRLNVRRHRARQKLLFLVGTLGSAIGLVLRRLRLTAPLPMAALSAVAVALVIAVGSGAPDRARDNLPLTEGTVLLPLSSPDPLPPALPGPAPAGPPPNLVAPSPAAHQEQPQVTAASTSTATPVAGIVFDPPGPVNEARIDARPREQEEPVLCLRTGGPEGTCVTVPFPDSPLDDVIVPTL